MCVLHRVVMCGVVLWCVFVVCCAVLCCAVSCVCVCVVLCCVEVLCCVCVCVLCCVVLCVYGAVVEGERWGFSKCMCASTYYRTRRYEFHIAFYKMLLGRQKISDNSRNCTHE